MPSEWTLFPGRPPPVPSENGGGSAASVLGRQTAARPHKTGSRAWFLLAPALFLLHSHVAMATSWDADGKTWCSRWKGSKKYQIFQLKKSDSKNYQNTIVSSWRDISETVSNFYQKSLPVSLPWLTWETFTRGAGPWFAYLKHLCSHNRDL